MGCFTSSTREEEETGTAKDKPVATDEVVAGETGWVPWEDCPSLATSSVLFEITTEEGVASFVASSSSSSSSSEEPPSFPCCIFWWWWCPASFAVEATRVSSTDFEDFEQMYLGFEPKSCSLRSKLMMAAVASVLKEGWCLINSSIEVPKLLAVSPIGSLLLLLLMAGKYSIDSKTLKTLSKGLQAWKACNPRELRQRAVKTFGREEMTSLVAGISFFRSACKTTSVSPDSWRVDNREGSWKT